MLKNYFIVAFRNFWRNKIFSLINIVGLAIGISASLVIYLLVHYDFTFDKFEKDGDSIYRVVSDFTFSGESFKNSGVPSPMPTAVKNEVTGLEIVAPFRTWNDNVKVTVKRVNGKPVVFKKQNSVVFADENYFKLLEYKWIAGSPKTSLQQPDQIVLTESNAKLYFPTLNAAQIVGKEIIFNDTIRTTITGVVKDLEKNTDFTFKTFISRATLESTSLKPEDWTEWGSTTSASQLLIKLSRGTTTMQVQSQIMKLFKKYHKQESDDHSTTAYSLQPLSDIHFNADYDNFDQRLAHKPTLYSLLAVAAFLLLLACINFINLTTAQASQRAKEIGIRKTMGSSKKQLVFQFLSETFLLTLIATILSLIITPLLLKVFSDFIPEGLHFSLIEQPGILLFLLLLVLSVTVLSGFYPAIVLSSYQPVLVLKNQAYSNTGKSRSAWLRKSLTVSQFVIAQVFIIATILVSKQISYSLNKDLGFKKDAIVNFNTNYYDTVQSHRLVLLDKIKAIPEVAMVSLSNNPPSSNSTWSSSMKYKDGKKEIETDVQVKIGDTNYIKLYQMKLLAGTNLPYSDTVHNLLINETYAHILGFQQPQQAIGKYIEWNSKQNPIVGVVTDFHQHSLHDPIKPLIIATNTSQERNFSIALQRQNPEGTTWKTAISKIEKAYKQVFPEDDFEYSFFDESIAKYYTAEQNISKLLMWATSLAIFISCLGLLGLAIYITNQRTKEIGIRKVVGASVTQIVSLLSKDFLKLIIIAFVIAIPIAWYGAHAWLQNFAYRTNISWWVFLSGGSIMFFIALIILCIRTFKAANANPVKSLRTE
jgi:putative ABC transport system permease protein